MKGNFKTLFRKFCLEGSISVMKYFFLYPDRISRCFWAVVIVSMFGLAWFLTFQLYTRFADMHTTHITIENQCFWAVVIVSMIGLAWFLTFQLYMRFADMPTRITIENQFEPLRALPFPAVTICSPNQLTLSAVSHFNKTLVDGNMTSDVAGSITQLLGFYEPILYFDKKRAEQLQSLIDLNRYTVSEVMSLLPQRCEDFLQTCQLDHKQYPRCEGLFSPVLTTQGLCCSFNSKYQYSKYRKRNEIKPNFVSRLVSSSSLINAFTVVVDYKPADALDGTLLNAGGIWVVLFTDHTEFPADDVSNLVLANTESFHIIHATHTYCSEDVKLLPESSRKCYLQDERRLPYFQEYHNSDCDHLCLVETVKRRCGCELFYVPGLHVSHSCNVTNIECITETKLQQHTLQRSEDCSCLRDCESRRYAVEMSTGNLDALPYLLNDIYSGITFNKSTAIMHFFFSNSVYVKQKQETVISVITLVSNLGGVFGLCVGCSVMSLFEMFFFIYTAIKNHVRYRIRKRNSRIKIFKQ